MKKINTDLCIVGGGTGGMCTAIHAWEMGIKDIVILEKRKVIGGCCPSFSMMLGINTPTQKRMGIEVDLQKVYLEHMKIQNWDCDAKLVSRWFNKSTEVMEWLEGLGVEFTEVLESGNFGDQSMRMMHCSFKKGVTTGTQIYRALKGKIAEYGIQVEYQTRAYKLLKDSAGHITGVLAHNQNGDEVEVSAQAVMISTGSISGSSEALQKYIAPRKLRGVERVDSAMPHNSGDGLRMVEEAGGRVGQFSVMYYGPHNHPYSNAICMLIRRPLVMAVNRNGERFANESIVVDGGGYQWMSGNALQNQPGQIQYTLLDHANLRNQIDHPTYEAVIESTLALLDFESEEYKNHEIKSTMSVAESKKQSWLARLEKDLHDEAVEGRVCIADSLDEIAMYIGCNPNILKAEVEKYNRFCEEGCDREFAKDKRHLRPIAEPPYYAIKLWQGIDTVMGGITVNHHLEVLDNNDTVIPGLYASGVGVSGFVGQGYGFPGTESSFTMSSAFLVAEEVAAKLSLS